MDELISGSYTPPNEEKVCYKGWVNYHKWLGDLESNLKRNLYLTNLEYTLNTEPESWGFRTLYYEVKGPIEQVDQFKKYIEFISQN